MKNFRVPHIYVMVFILLVFMALMTYVLPTGAYERYTDEVSGRTLVAAGSYTVTEASPVSLLGVFQAIPRGMSAAADVIFFVFVVGGAFGVLNATGVIELGIHHSMQRLRRAACWLIPALMGALFGDGRLSRPGRERHRLCPGVHPAGPGHGV